MLLRRLIVMPGLLAALAPSAGTAAAQTPEADDGLNVFVDCQTFGCDQDYFRTEIAWVNWVRDRQVADIHVLVTAQSTAAGGQMYHLNFIGRTRFAAIADTLTVSTAPTATDDDRRRLLAHRLRIGLLRYAAETPLVERVQISVADDVRADTETAPAEPADDPWNFWVFRVGLNGNANGQSLSSYGRISTSINASRITPEWKITLRTNGSYDENTFELSDGEEIRTIRRNYSLNALLVSSWGPRWSAGVMASVSSSTFSNYDLAARVAPAIEYNLFPYEESTRRQLTARYSVGPRYHDYEQETLYGKLTDDLIEHGVELEYETRQPWGSIRVGASASHYLSWEPAPETLPELDADAARYSLGVNGGFDLRLFRGLSLNLFGFYSKVRNQIGLPRGEAADEDILLRIRELDTDYNFNGFIGLSYTFGSIYNNVVNPRFGDTGEGTVFFF